MWGGQEKPSPGPTSSSPVLGGQQGGISQFPPSTDTQLGRGMGVQGLWEILLWRDNTHMCLGSYLIILRRNQSRC